MKSGARYRMLLKQNNKSVNTSVIKTHVVSPKEDDYKTGYVKRYFAQKANDIHSHIYEISRSQFSSIKSSPYYVSVTIDWRISGEPIDVKRSNSASIRIGSEVIPKLSLYLPNLLQFHKK